MSDQEINASHDASDPAQIPIPPSHSADADIDDLFEPQGDVTLILVFGRARTILICWPMIVLPMMSLIPRLLACQTLIIRS